MVRVLVERFRWRYLHQLAQIHHEHSITYVMCYCEVMSNEQIGEIELISQILEEIQGLSSDRDIERRHRFVANDQLRFERKSPCDRYALTLPTGQLSWPASRKCLWIEAHRLQ
jgi:hypothetical protein